MTQSDDSCARRLEALQRLAHIGVWEWDVQTDETYWSDETFRLFGLQPGEIKPGYEAARRHTHPDDFEKWATAVQQAVQSGNLFSLDYRALRKDGSIIWIHDEADVLRDEQGRALKFSGVTQDISEHMRALESLAEQQRNQQAILDASTESVFLMDADGTVIAANRAVAERLSVSLEQIIGANIYQFIPPELFVNRRRNIERAIASGQPVQFEDQYSGRTMLYSLIPIFDPHGMAVRLAVFGLDISDRAQAEQALRESEERFRFVFEHSQVAKSMTSPGGQLCPNQALLDLLGYTAEEAQGINWRDITQPDDLEENRVIVQSILDGESDSAFWEKRYIHKNGQIIPTEIHTYLQRDAQGKPQYFISTVVDLSARKQAEARLLEALESKEILLKELYHRTKNNMQVISSLLAAQAALSSDRHLKHILNENAHRIKAMALVHQKLYQSSDLSHIPFDEYLRELIPLLISSYRLDCERICVVYDLEPVELDLNLAISTGMLVNELLTNALKYAYPNERPGQIQIGLRRCPNGEIELIVADNGVGFPPNFIPAQAKTLGLMLIEKTVKLQLKGRMEVHSYPGVQYRIYFKEKLPNERT